MKPSSLLCAKSSAEGVVVIEGLYSNKLHIVGSSVAKFIANEEYSNSATFSIKKGDRGFIAVYVAALNGKHAEYFDFFLGIEWTEDSGTPRIGLDSQWVPMDPERLGVVNFSGIRTEIDDVIFSSNEYDKEPSIRYVSDHNLLCKYLAGDIEADVLEKAVAEYVEEESARAKLPELEKRIQELTTLVAEKEKLLVEKEELVLAEKKLVEKYYQQDARTYERLNVASKVIREVEKQWFHRPSLKKELQKYKAVMMWA